MVVALTPRHWKDLVSVTGMGAAVAALEEGLGADFAREADRYTYREALAALFARWFGERTIAEVTAGLTGTAVLWDRYRSFTDLVTDPGVRANPLMSTVDQPGVGPYLAPGCPLTVDGQIRPAVPAPTLGAHTAEILAEVRGTDSAENVGGCR